MESSWLLMAITAGIASNLANFIARYLIKDDKDAATFSLAIEIFRALAFGIAAFFDFYINWSVKTVMLLLMLGFFEPVAVYVFSKMHEHTHLSFSSIISRTRMIWVAIFAFVFLGESLSLIQYLGIFVLFLGLSTAVAPHKLFVDKGIKISLLFALSSAVTVILIKALSASVSLPVMMIWMSLPSIFIIPFFTKNPKKRIVAFMSTRFSYKILFNVVNFFAIYGYIFAIKYGSVSIVTAIYHSMIVFAVLAGIIFLREREDIAQKIAGAIITVIGVFFLTGQW